MYIIMLESRLSDCKSDIFLTINFDPGKLLYLPGSLNVHNM